MDVGTLFKDRQGMIFHGLALCYALSGYVIGFYGLFSMSLWIKLAAVLLLGHAMTIAAYLIHECGHNTVFRENRHNARLGSALSWLCGANYGTFEDVRHKHFRHHVDVDDVVWFDYEKFLVEHPRIYRLVCLLEWFYIPAHDLLMHGVMMFGSFLIPERRRQRRHNLRAILVRGGLFALLLWYAPLAAVAYMLAYMLMMTILRFMDGLQHDYPYTTNLFTDERSPHKGDKVWEQAHTFSNVISFRYEWPNWLVLNFGYHNAHHARPTVPWFRLPGLHRELFGDDPALVIPLWPQLRMFHRHRVSRILHNDPQIPDVSGADFLQAARLGRVDGGNAASFLTSF